MNNGAKGDGGKGWDKGARAAYSIVNPYIRAQHSPAQYFATAAVALSPHSKLSSVPLSTTASKVPAAWDRAVTFITAHVRPDLSLQREDMKSMTVREMSTLATVE